MYNPGGPGMAPTPGVPYSTLAPPQVSPDAAAAAAADAGERGQRAEEAGARTACAAPAGVAMTYPRAAPASAPHTQTVRITHTLWNPMQVTWCQYNGTFTRDPHACSKLVGLT